MKPELHLNLKQNLSLSPKLQQAIRLLQLSTYELDAEIQTALDTNPLLEINYDEECATEYKNQPNFEVSSDLQHAPDLHDYLLWQLNLSPFSEHDYIIALTLIDSINEDGYLITDLEDIRCTLSAQYPTIFNELNHVAIQSVLDRVQQFDPLGVGARNISECMLLQIHALKIDAKLLNQCKLLINNYLDLLGKKHFAQLKEQMRINDTDLAAIIKQIKNLHPKPGLIFAAQNTEYLIPDVLAAKQNNLWNVSLNPTALPKLRINANYAQIMRHAQNAQDIMLLRKQYNEAQWLIDSIKNRNLTLLKVAQHIVQFQQDFLQHGEEKMRPLILQEVALALNLSESTISRITNKKYLHTPRGTYELKYFFSSNVITNAGELCSATAAKAIIKQLIAAEDSAQPLSDQEVTNLMAERGIIIARRTVAKYRESLGIQASNQRGI